MADFSYALDSAITKPFAQVYSEQEGEGAEANLEAIHTQLSQVKPGSAAHMTLTQDQKDYKRTARRIQKAVSEPLKAAARKEAELKGREHEEEIRKLDAMGMFASAKEALTADNSPVKKHGRSTSLISATSGASPEDEDVEMLDAPAEDEAVIHLNVAGKEDTVSVPNKKRKKKNDTPASDRDAPSCASSSHGGTAKNSKTPVRPAEPPSPPDSAEEAAAMEEDADIPEDASDVFANGGVPWYLAPFDLEGTTVHEERYTGREVMRAMSEALTDMGDDELTELAISGVAETPGSNKPRTRSSAVGVETPGGGKGLDVDVASGSKKKPKKKGRRQQWTKPRVR